MKALLKSLSRAFLRVLLGVAVVVALIWIVVAQPSCSWSKNGTPLASAANLEAHVVRIATDLSPRSSTHLTNLNACADYIEQQFAATGHPVERQWYTPIDDRYCNISCHFGPTNGPRIVVGAHYDACDTTPGADDNASGVAGLLELARLLAETPPSHHIELVAYSLEEPPFFRSSYMGSAQHARRIIERGEPIAYMVAIEMIGYFTDAPNSQRYPAPMLHLMYPPTGNFLALVGRLGERSLISQLKAAMVTGSPLPIHSICAPSQLPGIDFSDHASYWEADIPAVMVTDTAFYRNPHYHQPTDTPDTLDYVRMAQAVDAIHAMISTPTEEHAEAKD